MINPFSSTLSFAATLSSTIAVLAAAQQNVIIPEDKPNVNGGNVFANYLRLRENRQAFLKGVAISGEL